MFLLELLGQFLTLNEFAVLAIFLTFIFMLFRGIPVAFALVGVSLIFILIAETLLDPNRRLINEFIEFDRTASTTKGCKLSPRACSATSCRTRCWWPCPCSSSWV